MKHTLTYPLQTYPRHKKKLKQGRLQQQHGRPGDGAPSAPRGDFHAKKVFRGGPPDSPGFRGPGDDDDDDDDGDDGVILPKISFRGADG